MGPGQKKLSLQIDQTWKLSGDMRKTWILNHYIFNKYQYNNLLPNIQKLEFPII